ncbi:ATP-binding protein [Paenibacillus sp. Soil787]|uniref:ATP-binding protein n=1 Tax=Paenibacillus sp. Soil787 TaxID=1736411 RepID=UPI0006FEB688|nr:AAA family ATPase [Paenibacillus sp. Soil787]KRF39113.1 hypothetical protein ASG93_23395 [Paenibacillus sp. Soil787]
MDLLSQEKILKVLLGYNPWWANGHVPKEFTRPVKRLAFYEASKIFHHAQIRREVILSGPRRVGKTTILYQMIEQELNEVPPKAILYVSFDHPILKLVDIGKILEIFQNNIAHDQTALFLFFDEIQYASDWDLWLKTLYDSQPSYKIMATGSASPVLAAKATESGVGRWTLIRIPTLSFYEYIEIKPLLLTRFLRRLVSLAASNYFLLAHCPTPPFLALLASWHSPGLRGQGPACVPFKLVIRLITSPPTPAAKQKAREAHL